MAAVPETGWRCGHRIRRWPRESGHAPPHGAVTAAAAVGAGSRPRRDRHSPWRVAVSRPSVYTDARAPTSGVRGQPRCQSAERLTAQAPLCGAAPSATAVASTRPRPSCVRRARGAGPTSNRRGRRRGGLVWVSRPAAPETRACQAHWRLVRADRLGVCVRACARIMKSRGLASGGCKGGLSRRGACGGGGIPARSSLDDRGCRATALDEESSDD